VISQELIIIILDCKFFIKTLEKSLHRRFPSFEDFFTLNFISWINKINRSGKRRRPRDEAFFGFCTVEDDDILSPSKMNKTVNSKNNKAMKALEQ